MMTRRAALAVALVLGVLATPPAAEAQQAKRVGVLYYGVPSASADLRALLDGLREPGWVDGRNVIFDVRYAEGRTERFPELAAEVVRQKPDLIVATGTPGSVAAKNATSTISIVMIAVSDPVGAKLVPSLSRPGGNITGLSLLAQEWRGCEPRRLAVDPHRPGRHLELPKRTLIPVAIPARSGNE